MDMWLPNMNRGIATCLNRAIGMVGLSPTGLRPSRPLHPSRIAARATSWRNIEVSRFLALLGVTSYLTGWVFVPRGPRKPALFVLYPINAHVSTKPSSHPGQSDFPSPVVGHSYPLMPFLPTGEA